MAAGLFAARSQMRDPKIHVASAGIAALVGHPPPAPIVELMASRGLDVSAHRGRQLTMELACQQDLILVMESAQQKFIEQKWTALRGRVRRLGLWRDEDLLDPYGLSEEFYADCLDHIETYVTDWEERLLS
jgi:protein-tyrosine phosphatase